MLTRGESNGRRICALICLASIALSACSHGGGPSASAAEKHARVMWTRIGTELAIAAAQQQPANGSVLLVREASRPGFGPGQDLMEAAFRSKKGSASAITAVTVPSVPVPDPIPWNYVPPVKLNAGWLTTALQQHGPASLVISLVDEPSGALPADKAWPPIICFSGNGSTNLGVLIRSGVVAAAVAPRHTNPKSGEKDWFELRYTVVNKSNVDQWLSELPARH